MKKKILIKLDVYIYCSCIWYFLYLNIFWGYKVILKFLIVCIIDYINYIYFVDMDVIF